MTADGFYRTMIEFLHREPFRPFTLQMVDGRRIEIYRPSVAIRGGVATFIARRGIPVPLDNDEVERIIDAPAEMCPSAQP